MKHAICLSGGGGKGALQLGSVQILRDNGIKFSASSGISVGALNGALIAQDKISELETLWDSVSDNEGGLITNGNLTYIKDGKLAVDFKKVKETAMKGVSKWDITKALTSTFFKGQDFAETAEKIFLNLDNSSSLLDNSPLVTTLIKYVKREDFKMPYYFGITELISGNGYELNNKDFASDKDLVNAIVASATMPVIWDSVRFIQTKKLSFRESVDGGLRTVSPLGQIFDTIEKTKESEDWTIWVVNCNSRLLPALEDTKRMTIRAGRTLDVLLNQVFNDDLTMTIKINEIADQIGKRKVQINIIEPGPGVIGGTLDFRKETIQKRIDIGRALASDFFPS